MLPLLAAAALLAYFFYFAAPLSLQAGFTHDDLMNMHRAVTEPRAGIAAECLLFWLPSDQYRPAGALLYRALHDAFGFTPLPFHVAMMLILAAGHALVFDFVSRLSGSREMGALVVLLAAYHANRPFFMINFGFCYDALCLLFYFAALVYYVRIRQRGERPKSWQHVRLALLLAMALGSKEMAVSLPLVVGAYEWLAHPRGERSWTFPVFSALAVAAFIQWRVLGADNIGGIDSYRPRLSFALYAESARHWLEKLFFLGENANPWPWLAGLGLTVAAAVAGRDRTLIVGLLLLCAGVLPLSFIRPMRGLEAVVIPTIGLAMILTWWIVRFTSVFDASWRAPVLFALLMAYLVRTHGRQAPPAEAMLAEGREIGVVLSEFQQAFPPGVTPGRVLITRDPFPLECCRWGSTFMLQILHGTGVTVDRADTFTTAPDPATYDFVYAWENRRLVSVRQAPF